MSQVGRSRSCLRTTTPESRTPCAEVTEIQPSLVMFARSELRSVTSTERANIAVSLTIPRTCAKGVPYWRIVAPECASSAG